MSECYALAIHLDNLRECRHLTGSWGDLSRALSSFALSALSQGCMHVSTTQQLRPSVEVEAEEQL